MINKTVTSDHSIIYWSESWLQTVLGFTRKNVMHWELFWQQHILTFAFTTCPVLKRPSTFNNPQSDVISNEMRLDAAVSEMGKFRLFSTCFLGQWLQPRYLLPYLHVREVHFYSHPQIVSALLHSLQFFSLTIAILRTQCPLLRCVRHLPLLHGVCFPEEWARIQRDSTGPGLPDWLLSLPADQTDLAGLQSVHSNIISMLKDMLL